MKAMLPLARRSRLSVTLPRGSCISGLSISKQRPIRPLAERRRYTNFTVRNRCPRWRSILRYAATCPSGMMKAKTR